MKKYLVSIVLILFVGFYVVQTGKKEKQSADPLTSVKWNFSGLNHTVTSKFESIPADLHSMNIVFGKSHRFQAQSSCNSVYGSFIIPEQNKIRIDSVSMTKMFCIDSAQTEWEDKYIAGLKSSVSFVIKGDTLSLRTGSDTDLIFIADQRKK